MMQIEWQRGGRDLVVAVQGCAHGALDDIYASLQRTEQQCGVRADVLLCCGDFQALRNEADMACLACPPKYRAMNSFWRYYSGEKVAPVLTIFIGGNHEASNHNLELYYGGWAAPNIYFLGFAGVVSVGGVRIGGLTGIYNGRHYRTGHYEAPPFSDDDMRSFYHIRELEVFRLMQLRQPACAQRLRRVRPLRRLPLEERRQQLEGEGRRVRVELAPRLRGGHRAVGFLRKISAADDDGGAAHSAIPAPTTRAAAVAPLDSNRQRIVADSRKPLDGPNTDTRVPPDTGPDGGTSALTCSAPCT